MEYKSASIIQQLGAALLSNETIFGTDLAKSLALVDAIKSGYDNLADKGVLGAVTQYAGS